MYDIVVPIGEGKYESIQPVNNNDDDGGGGGGGDNFLIDNEELY